MVVEICPPEQSKREAWDAYVCRSRHAGPYHLHGWRRVIERSYGHRGYYLWAHENDVTKGILPLIFIRSMLFGRSFVSLPFVDEGGICAEDDQTRDQLYREAFRLFVDHKADFLDLRHRRPSGLEIPSHGSKVTLVLPVADDPDRIWNSFDAKVRNQVRKASRSGLTASWNGAERLSDFYRIFSVHMRDLGSPVHSRRFFEAILNEFPNDAKLILVHKGSNIIGGGICLSFKDALYVPWASSLTEYFPLCPNHLLYWEAIRWGCEKGYKRFDFGRSSPGGGTYRFKKQWGAHEEPLHWQSVSRRGEQASVLQTGDPRYRWALQVWRHLPLAITNRVGPFLRKQISN
jgi:FemAB-related protein (PEP-CTERM system-associated)